MKKVIQPKGVLTVAIGVVYLWFGILKFFPGASPAEDLARRTIHFLTNGLIPDPTGIVLLAILEGLIGLSLLTGYFTRAAVWVAIGHMVLSFTPLISEPSTVWDHPPFDLTLTGQYIFKNLIILAALTGIVQGRR